MKGTNTKRILLVIVLSLFVIASVIRMLTVLYQEPMAIETLLSSEDVIEETSMRTDVDIATSEASDKVLATELYEIPINDFPVYICGSVLVPGVYEISRGTYVYQLIEMAGGLNENAAVNHINQVYSLVEPISIYIPSEDDVQDNPDMTDTLLVRSDVDTYIWGSGEEPRDGGITEEPLPTKVNINTSGRDELMTLSGVGLVTADAIINYRDSIAPFTCIEDIMNVPGIKTARFEAIKQQITV